MNTSAYWGGISSLEELDRCLVGHRQLLAQKRLREAMCTLPEKYFFETATGQVFSAIALYDLMAKTPCDLDVPCQALESLASRSTPFYPFTNFFLHAYLSQCLSKMDRNTEAAEHYELSVAALENIPAGDRPALADFLASTREAVPS